MTYPHSAAGTRASSRGSDKAVCALHYGSGPVDPSNANQPLIDLLTAKLYASP